MSTNYQSTNNQPSVTSSSERILGYDFARALAFIGMVIVNFKVVMNASRAGSAWFVWLVGLLDGRAAATFVVLAGVGLSLLSQRARLSGNKQEISLIRNTFLKRAGFLFVAGLLYALIWPADILHFYGVYIAIGAFLLVIPEKWLWGLTFLFIGLSMGLFILFDYGKGWDWNTLTYIDFWTGTGMIRHLFFNGFHPVFPWIVFLLVGMWLGRQDINNPAFRKKLLWGSLIVVAVIETISWGLIQILSSNASIEEKEMVKLLFGTEPMPPLPLYILAGSGTAIVVIILSVIFMERFATAKWSKPFVATGQMTLTLYVAHVVVGMGVLEAFDRLENQSLLFAINSATLFCLAAMIFSYFWRKWFKRGPLEWVMRFVTWEQGG